MSLKKVGNRKVASETALDLDGGQLGIPGSQTFPLFYQDGRRLPIISHGQGIYLWDMEGNRYLDGCSGACSANIGHAHPRVIQKAHEQMSRVAFAYRTQFESEAANELADLLVRLSPPELNRVFFVNSGSEAVEAAIKLARQYWWAMGKPGKQHVIARRPSYHGATIGALSCTDYAPLNIPYRNMLLPFPKVSAPFCYHCPLGKEYPICEVDCARELERALWVLGPENISAFIAEPIGGASSGGAVPPDEYFGMVERICNEYEILFICDDVLTGCGRTGTFNGFAHWDVTPDIVAMSKGLTGGYTPMGACISSSDVVEPVLETGGFMHGHTYAGNPLSAAVAGEVIKVVIDEGLVGNSREMGTYLHLKLRELKLKYPIIGDIRGRGLLAGVEFVRDLQAREPFPANWYVAQTAKEIAREKGLIIYPRRSLYGLSGDHVLLAPPLIIDREGIDELILLFDRTLADLTKLLLRYIEPDQSTEHDGTFDRYQPAEELPDYALGNIDEVQPDPEANVTWTMVDPNLDHQAVAGPEGEPVPPPGAEQLIPRHPRDPKARTPTSELEAVRTVVDLVQKAGEREGAAEPGAEAVKDGSNRDAGGLSGPDDKGEA